MPRIKNKIYKWISSIPHRNMEDKETEPISGSPAKSLPLTDWKKHFQCCHVMPQTNYL